MLRGVVSVVALMAVLAAVLQVVRAHPDGPTLSAGDGSKTSTVVVVAGTYDGAVVNDLDAGTHHRVTLPRKAPGDFAWQLTHTGGYYVYNADSGKGSGMCCEGARTVRTLRDDFARAPVVLGKNVLYVPSANPGWVWLVSWPGARTTTAQEVRVDGSSRRARHGLPGYPLAGVPGGLLLYRGAGGYSSSVAVWHANTGKLGPTLFEGANAFIDAERNFIAWGTSCGTYTCRAAELHDLSTGAKRVFDAPDGTGWVTAWATGSGDAISANGRYVALGAAPTDSAPPASTDLYLADTQTGGLVQVPHSSNDAYARTGWSPDGGWLFFETTDHRIGAYRPADGKFRTFPGQCCRGTLVIAPR
jgi:hypothetical protein